MIRVRSLAATVIPALLVGALVAPSSSGHAAAGTEDSDWSGGGGGVIVADANHPQRGRIPRAPDPIDPWTAPAPPTPPRPPAPPRHARGRHGGVSISIDGNRVQIGGIDELVVEHLDAVRKVLRDNPDIPRDVRDRVNGRMDRVRGVIDRRLKNLKVGDLDRLEAELEKMGEELEQALEGLDRDLAQLGHRLSRDLAKQLGKDLFKGLARRGSVDFGRRDHDPDHDDDDDDADDDVGDPGAAISQLRGLALDARQRDTIRSLHARSEAQVTALERELEASSQRLEAALSDPKTTDAEVIRLVDQVSGHEAAIRKAKLLTWVQARRVLDADQVRQIERVLRAP
jgi:hypothetical protein